MLASHRHSTIAATAGFLVCFLFCSLSSVAQQTNEQLASYYFQNHEYDKAVELFDPLYQRTQNGFYYQMLYRSYVAMEHYKEAEKLVDKRMKLKPRDLYLYVDLGQLWLKQEETKKAERVFDKAIDQVSFDTKQLNDLVLAFKNANLGDYAIRSYLRYREKTQNRFAFVMELASLYENQGRYEDMMNEYFDLIDESSQSMEGIQIALQRVLNQTSNANLSTGLRKTIISRIQKSPNNMQYVEMMIWFSLQEKDFQFALTQAKAVDARFPGEGDQHIFRIGQIAHNNEDYATAIDCYKYIIKKGPENSFYYDCRVGELEAKFDRINKGYHLSSSDLAAIFSDYDAAISEMGKGIHTVQLMRNYAYLQAYYANNVQAAANMLYDVIEMPQVSNSVLNETKLELGDLLLFGGSIWDASLLYSQVEKANKNDVIGALAKFKNAKLSYYNNDFKWAKSQLDVLRASTSKLIANDAMELSLLISDNMEDDSTYGMLEMYAAADLLLYRNQLDSAWVGFDAITQRALSHPLFDEVLMQKAKIRMKQGRYADADSLLQKLIVFYATDILADDALMMLAELNEDKLNNLNRAQQCYEKLILDYPVSLYVDRARKRYNELKMRAQVSNKDIEHVPASTKQK